MGDEEKTRQRPITMDTTTICDQPRRELELEWMETKFKTHEVSLVIPQTSHSERIRILNMTPKTTLNLLSWLVQKRGMLELLAEMEQDNE